MDKILIGQILKPQGVKGELKVLPITKDANRFKNLKYVYVGCTKYDVVHCRVGVDGFCYLTLKDINSRDQAESLRECEMFVERVDAVKLEDNEFFIDDLMDCDVKSETGKDLGRVTDIENYGSADVITVHYGAGRKFSFANVYGVIVSVDAKNKIAVLNEQKLKEVRI